MAQESTTEETLLDRIEILTAKMNLFYIFFWVITCENS